jgi:hypothetical protein
VVQVIFTYADQSFMLPMTGRLPMTTDQCTYGRRWLLGCWLGRQLAVGSWKLASITLLFFGIDIQTLTVGVYLLFVCRMLAGPE